MARQNDHIRAEELMSAYLDQRMTAEEKQFLDQHLAACANCRAQLEATRSMIAALRAMPVVKAPRSFVLPREMAKQPKRSVFNWYPVLRLATVVAAIAFVILFAGDVLISRSGSNAFGVASVPAAAPAPPAMMNQAPASAAQVPAQPTAAPAFVGAPPTTAPAAQPPLAAGAAARSSITATTTLSERAATAVAAPTATPESTAVAMAGTSQPPARKAASSAESTTTATASASDPLRIIEIALLGLVIVLGAATLIVRRRQV